MISNPFYEAVIKKYGIIEIKRIKLECVFGSGYYGCLSRKRNRVSIFTSIGLSFQGGFFIINITKRAIERDKNENETMDKVRRKHAV